MVAEALGVFLTILYAPVVLRHGLLLLFAVVTAALGAAALGGCEGDEGLLLCGEIPLQGCPAGRGGSCTDETCAALYDCVEGRWTVVTSCGRDGGTEPLSEVEAGCEQAELDAGLEATGCKPDLQLPDCPVAAARTCVGSACLTGCLDFYACSTEGWRLVAYCDDDSRVVAEP